MSIRVPLQSGDGVRAQVEAEVEAARELHGRTRFPTPEPLAVGEPGEGCPVPWSVQTWLEGTDAALSDPGGSLEFAEDLADFIRTVRAMDTRGRAFKGTGRGGDLRGHDAWVELCFERSEGVLDVGGLWPADLALDLVGAWHLLEVGPRAALRDALGCGDVEWGRGRAWALEQAMGLVWYYEESNPVMSAIGRRTVGRLLADD
ncbi:MAG: phosphotransferase [Actinomycetales bacterium]|nr:phosphotransferase [Actinomycetales bacterium]